MTDEDQEAMHARADAEQRVKQAQKLERKFRRWAGDAFADSVRLHVGERGRLIFTYAETTYIVRDYISPFYQWPDYYGPVGFGITCDAWEVEWGEGNYATYVRDADALAQRLEAGALLAGEDKGKDRQP
jgi:hypothetical protein